MDAYGIFLRTVHLNLGDSFDHRNPLAHQCFGIAVHGVTGQSFRAHGEVEDRLVRRIHFVVGRRRRHVRRQLRRCAGDSGLHVLRGAVNVAAQVELQGNRGAAERTRRRHRINARDCGKLFFEWSRNGRSYGVGTRPGKRCSDLNRWVINVGKFADRERAIAEDSEQQNREHDQSGHDRTANKWFGDADHFPAVDFASFPRWLLSLGLLCRESGAAVRPLQPYLRVLCRSRSRIRLRAAASLLRGAIRRSDPLSLRK